MIPLVLAPAIETLACLVVSAVVRELTSQPSGRTK